MKAIFVFIAVVAVFGYMWYADMLPFDYQNPSAIIAPTPENIQQISNVITSSENKIIYYSFDDVPSIPDRQIPVDALKYWLPYFHHLEQNYHCNPQHQQRYPIHSDSKSQIEQNCMLQVRYE